MPPKLGITAREAANRAAKPPRGKTIGGGQKSMKGSKKGGGKSKMKGGGGGGH